MWYNQEGLGIEGNQARSIRYWPGLKWKRKTEAFPFEREASAADKRLPGKLVQANLGNTLPVFFLQVGQALLLFFFNLGPGSSRLGDEPHTEQQQKSKPEN
jgi:hypothetical protein